MNFVIYQSILKGKWKCYSFVINGIEWHCFKKKGFY